MDLREFIESGILENYVLGLASAEERREVEQMAQAHPEVKEALLAIEEDLTDYARSQAPPMPEGLREKILQRIDAEGSAGPASPKSPAVGSWPMAVAVLLLAGLAFLFWKNRQVRAAHEQTRNELQALQTDCAEQGKRLLQMQEQIAILRDDSYRPVIMEGTEKAPGAIAAVYWNPEKREAYLDTRSLPTPPAGKQYQLWALVGGQPVDMGVFDLALQAEFQQVPFIENPDAFAVTLEPAGGSVSPTLEEMYVVGGV